LACSTEAPCAALLKICRMDKVGGSCTGNEEVFLLCDKVQRGDVLLVARWQSTRLPNNSLKVSWVTVYKTARPMLSVRCLCCLSVTLVHCGQTVGWVKMKLSVQVGLGPSHIVLDGDPAPLPAPPKGHSPPNFRPISVVAKWLHGSRCHLVWR